MDLRSLLGRLDNPAAARPLFMPDLSLWFEWHSRRGTFPEECRGSSLAGIAASLNCPAWILHTPWRLDYEGVEVTREKSGSQRIIRYRTKYGTLSETWDLGPDGDWWQKEYPVKDEDDLDAAEEIVKAMRYELEASKPPEAGSNIDAVQIPKTPYSDMLHTLLGWSDGLMLMIAEEDRLTALLEIMEEKRNGLIQNLAAAYPASLFWAPDNLDGQFISPAAFGKYLQPSYRKTCEMLHQGGSRLWVHIGGMCRHLLAPMAACGIDGLAGISGPPQSDAALSEARQLAGPNITLWGGIPQDYVMPMVDRSLLAESMEQARSLSATDSKIIVGIADHVPVEAEFSRLKEISEFLNL